jgi:hypothetical protein
MNSTLVNAYSISPVSKFLVVAWEATWEGIGFCKVLNNSDVSRQAAPPLAPAAPPLTPAAPRTQTGPPQGPGYGYASAPAASIQACSELNHANPNNRCVGLGGGRNGFWRQAPWILINFKPLAPSSHTLTVYYTGKNRNGAWIQTRHWNKTFNNTSTNWEVWFRSPLTVGDDCLPCNLSFVLDGRNVGAINLEGSFE